MRARAPRIACAYGTAIGALCASYIGSMDGPHAAADVRYVPGFDGLEFVVAAGSDKRTLVFRDAQHEYTFTEK